MGLPETGASPPHLYPQTLQLKLYQAFIFSIPILFSIILFLLFYLFYLKKRISNASSPTLPTTLLNHSTSQPPMSEGGLKVTIQKVKLPVILFGEDSTTKESQCCCCICLGEFEVKEEVHQIPACTHIFHIQCITHWLRSNSTCPMCRTCVLNHNRPINHQNGQPTTQDLLASSSNCSTREEEVIITVRASSSNTL